MKKGFTLVEVIISLIIVGIIVTFAIPTYRNAIERSKAKVCEVNQEVILGALEIFIEENDALPASLSNLKNRQIEKAFAKVLKRGDAWKIKLAYFLVGLDERGVAHAQWIENYTGTLSILKCPSDDVLPSYGISSTFASATRTTYEAAAENAIIIGDCDNITFATVSSLASRHKIFTATGFTDYPIRLEKGGCVLAERTTTTTTNAF